MANVGGYIRGPWWRYNTDDEEQVRRCYVAAWGNIVKIPTELYTTKSLVRFIIKTGRGANRNEKHLVCVGFGTYLSTLIMKSLEKQDIVLCFGTWYEKLHPNTKKKTPVYEMQVKFIVPLGLIGFVLDLFTVGAKMSIGLPKFLYGLYMDENLRKIAEKNADDYDKADPFEWDD